jgi:hypothetical protein
MAITERDLRNHFPQRLNAFGRPIRRKTFGTPVTTDPDARCHCGELVVDHVYLDAQDPRGTIHRRSCEHTKAYRMEKESR